MRKSVNSIKINNQITVIPRSAAMPLAHTKVQQRSGGSAFLPHDKAKQQQIPRAKQLARGMTVSF
jgi:hypothetical protein